MSDYIQKFLFESLPLKGAFVVLKDSYQTILKQKEYPQAISQLMGELLLANTLLTSSIKINGKISCQIQDNPALSLLVSECTSEYKIRATAKVNSQQANLNYNDCLNKGRLVVSIDSNNDGNIYQSVIAFNGSSLSKILNNYMLQSEQLKTWFLFAYQYDRMVGFMLQQLPEINIEHELEVERVFALAENLTMHELLTNTPEELLNKLFATDNIFLFDSLAVEFECSCSRVKVSNILRSLGKDELETILREEKIISVDCDFCGAKYSFSEEELKEFVLSISIEEIAVISNKIN